jgi:hypothetical protein
MRIEPYAVPKKPQARLHGPAGYKDYRKYKPWLRDEFKFRCVYCMQREKWEKSGYRGFHVDHRVPQSVDETKILEYDNLVYSCGMCNTYKSDEIMPDPCEVPLGLHYEFDENGSAKSLSGEQGEAYIEILGLNEEEAVDYRARWMQTLREFNALCDTLQEPKRNKMLERWFGYPIDIPDLRLQRPPTNSKEQNETFCHYALLKRGEIERVY